MKIKAGDYIWFYGEKQKYIIQSCDDRFVICTKPFNARKTVTYSIIDFERNIRGRENLIFCMGFETKKECEEALERLQKGESEVSYRHYEQLEITKIIHN